MMPDACLPKGPEEFRARRQQLGLSQRLLGQEIGRTREHIVEYEAGRAAIPPVVWRALECLELERRTEPKK